MTHKPPGNKIEKRKNGGYDEEYKVQAVKLAKNLGSAKAAAEELQIPVNTLYGWIQKVKTAELDIGCGERSPEESQNLSLIHISEPTRP